MVEPVHLAVLPGRMLVSVRDPIFVKTAKLIFQRKVKILLHLAMRIPGKVLVSVKDPIFRKTPKLIFHMRVKILFAFDEDDFEPSKWDVLSGKKNISLWQQNEAAYRELDDTLQLIMSQEASSNGENHQAHETSYSGAVGREGSGLLADCVLTAVKVLMNLANDNPVVCQQIAANGGLETLSSLIANHFPLFCSFSSPFSEKSEYFKH